MPDAPISIAECRLPADIQTARTLFQEYIDSLGVDLSFQDTVAELDGLPGKYAPPTGRILIARDPSGTPVGCVAMRPLAEAGTCEMKRLYVRPQARGQDLGRRLAEAIIAYAKSAGYHRVRLDTLSSMRAAHVLYASLGFQPTEPYQDSPLSGTIYLTLKL